MFGDATFHYILFGITPFVLGFALLLGLGLYSVWHESRETRQRLYLKARPKEGPRARRLR